MKILKGLFIVLTMTIIVIAQGSNNTMTVKDADGNVYTTVTIGNQVWMVENLKTTKYNDGTAIQLITDDKEWWYNTGTPAYCWYGNDISNKDKFGALYNWYAVNTNKLAPAGWHVATDADWDILQNYLISNGYNWNGTTSGNKIAIALAAKTDWDWGAFSDAKFGGEETDLNGAVANNLNKNNSSKFSAFPGGYRETSCMCIDLQAMWWTSTECVSISAYVRYLYFTKESLLRSTSGKAKGCSVRLVKN